MFIRSFLIAALPVQETNAVFLSRVKAEEKHPKINGVCAWVPGRRLFCAFGTGVRSFVRNYTSTQLLKFGPQVYPSPRCG